MERKWPNKKTREEFEIGRFILAYEHLYKGQSFVIESRGDRDKAGPDFFIKNRDTGAILGVELTSVYSSDRSVPDVHMKPKPSKEWVEILYDSHAIERYKDCILEKIREKVGKAKKNYETRYPLILAIYLNEYHSIYMDVEECEELVNHHQNVFNTVAPFSEIVFWNLPIPNPVFSVRPETVLQSSNSRMRESNER
jgi:hypothetical protein